MEVYERVRHIYLVIHFFCHFLVLKCKEDNVPSEKDKVIYYGV